MHTDDVAQAAACAASHAASADRAGQMHPDVLTAVRGSGLLRHFVPRQWGGGLDTFTDAAEALSRMGHADPAAGWCTAVMMSAARMATHLPPAGQQVLWGDDPDTMIAATLRPEGTAVPVKEGWLLDGTWHYVSGVTHCRWALLSTRSGTENRFMLVPRRAWSVEDTWDAVGLRATGTHTVSVARTFVPAAHSFTRQQLMDGRSTTARSVPHEAVSGLFFVAPLLGAATQFLHTSQRDWIARAGEAGCEGRALALGHGVGYLAAAESLMMRAARTADADRIGPATTRRLRLEYATIADILGHTVGRLFREGGTRAASDAGPLARIWRDVSTGLLHPALSLARVAIEYAQSAQPHHETSPPV